LAWVVLGVLVLVVLFDLWVLAFLVFCVFVVLVVESVPVPLANTGIANEKTTMDANKRLSSFFMLFLLHLDFAVRSS
jgi:hypothetical protein